MAPTSLFGAIHANRITENLDFNALTILYGRSTASPQLAQP
jgi:hypothetical protein